MKRSPVIVLGLGPAGLFLVRQLSHLTESIYAIGRYDDVGMYSRHIDKKKRYYAYNADELKDAFSKIKEIEEMKPLLFISSDQYLSILLDKKNEWSEQIELAGANIDTLELINDKNAINAFCQLNGVRIPESVTYSEFQLQRRRMYPVIIKWVEKRIETAVNPIGKVKVCWNDTEFLAVDRAVKEGGIHAEDLFVQAYINGKNDCQFSVGGYYNNGVPLAEVAVNQIKQYPQGISAEVITSSNPICTDLKQISGCFVSELNYTGFLEMEYKVDARTRETYLLDVNPRPWGWISILGAVYLDFYKVLDGQKPIATPQNAVWKSPLRILAGKKNKQNVEPQEDIMGFKTAYDIRDRDDSYPSAVIYYMTFKKIVKRFMG